MEALCCEVLNTKHMKALSRKFQLVGFAGGTMPSVTDMKCATWVFEHTLHIRALMQSVRLICLVVSLPKHLNYRVQIRLSRTVISEKTDYIGDKHSHNTTEREATADAT